MNEPYLSKKQQKSRSPPPLTPSLIEMWSMDESNEAVTRRSRKIILMKACERRQGAGCWALVQPAGTGSAGSGRGISRAPASDSSTPSKHRRRIRGRGRWRRSCHSNPPWRSTFIHVTSATILGHLVFAALASLLIGCTGLSPKWRRNPGGAAQRRSSSGSAQENTSVKSILGNTEATKSPCGAAWRSKPPPGSAVFEMKTTMWYNIYIFVVVITSLCAAVLWITRSKVQNQQF